MVPIQHYGWGDYLDSGSWYRYNLFLGRLYDRYSFLPINDYLWRFAQGDSALTPESVRFALSESVDASRTLQQLGQELGDLIDGYERGELTQAEFSRQLEDTAKEIRRAAKQIRKDYFLDYLEQNNSGLVPDYSKPRSLEQLRGLSLALQHTAEQIGDLLNGYIARDTTRVVSVDDLQQVSTEVLSKRIDRMAKAIEKSGRNL